MLYRVSVVLTQINGAKPVMSCQLYAFKVIK